METAEATRDLRELLEQRAPDRESLIPLLQDVQRELGYVSQEAVREVAAYLDVTDAEVYGVASFYTQFRFTRPGEHMVLVCSGTACHVRGSARLAEHVVGFLGIRPGETTADYKFSLETVSCFGSCALSPVMVVDGHVYGRMTPKKAISVLKELR